MRKYLRVLATVLIFAVFTNVIAFATEYSAEYESGYVDVACYVEETYAGKPATISLRLKSDPFSIPEYFNDTIIGRDGEVNLSFLHEIDNVNKYFIRLNVAGAYIKDIAIPGDEASVERNMLSQFTYYADDQWYSLDSGSYQNVLGKKSTIGVAVPEEYQGKCEVLFVAKHSDGELKSFAIGENYESNKYKALVNVPENGIIEIYCWDSMETMEPYCDKVTLPADCMQQVVFAENPAPIAENPGKGWVRYRSDSTEKEDVLQYVSVGYNRFNWNQVEPSEGVYDWTVIDEFINKWDALGKKAAFGIACASSTNATSYLTPKWVFDAGAAYTTFTTSNGGTQYVPVWNDEVFLAKLDNFTKAFAEKYDGDSRIAFIDIRSYGNFGETHTSELTGSVGISANDEKKHIDIAAKYFKKTQLMLCTANTGEQGIKTEYAVSNGIGLRTDSIMNGNYSETHRIDDAYGKEPTVFEFVNSYSNMKDLADSYGSESNDNGHWNEDRYLLSFFVGKPSYMDLGQYNNDSEAFIQDNRELIELLSNKMGYHFVLKSMNIPASISAEEAFIVDAEWINKGVAPLYEECYPALAVLDNNNKVIDKCWLDGVNPGEWMPGTNVTESAAVEFVAMYGDSVKLAIGLFNKKTDSSPSYKIGNYNGTSDNWYVIANGIKGENGYALTPASQPEQVQLNQKLDNFYNSRIAPFYDVETTTNIISDSTIESSEINWYPILNNSTVIKSTEKHSGTYGGRIDDRINDWSGAQIDITDLLKENGAGTYRFTGWFRTGAATSRTITVCPFRINSITEYSFTASIGRNWTQVTQDIVITQEQIDKMTHAVTLIRGSGSSYLNTADIYFDDITLTKIN